MRDPVEILGNCMLFLALVDSKTSFILPFCCFWLTLTKNLKIVASLEFLIRMAFQEGFELTHKNFLAWPQLTACPEAVCQAGRCTLGPQAQTMNGTDQGFINNLIAGCLSNA